MDPVIRRGDTISILNMKKQSAQTAFTLLELSLVVLFVGILLVGVLQGSKLVSIIRVNSAQSLTQSSPVGTIKDLVLWLEPTTSGSFAKEYPSDGEQLAQWNNRAANVNTKYYAVTTASPAITYKEKGPIYNLPSVYFSGANSGYFTISTTNSLSGISPIVSQNNNAFTFFAVVKSDAVGANGSALFSNGDVSGYSYILSNSGERKLVFTGSTISTVATATKNPEIISVTYVGGNDGEVKLYTNGVAETLDVNTATATTPLIGLYIGGNSSNMPWTGYISEVILFNRILNHVDRSLVEKYLGQKYNINVKTNS